LYRPNCTEWIIYGKLTTLGVTFNTEHSNIINVHPAYSVAAWAGFGDRTPPRVEQVETILF
jgi:hypothetical protein